MFVIAGNQELVAKGTILSVDPDRIIAKRAVLSGFPYKINKKACVVRYMFFNRGNSDPQIRVCNFFLFLNQNICCGYSKEPSR